MKERGMIFNAEMVRAILDGRKTQTRRIVQGVDGAAGFRREWDINGEEFFVVFGEKDHTGMNPVLGAISCPFGAVGDRIWVREAFQGPLIPEEELSEFLGENPDKFESPEYCEYAADGGPRPEYVDADDTTRYGWRPSIHMPRWASRILLEITDVRVERLASVSDEDAGKEGYPADPSPFGGSTDKWLWFRQLWDGIYPEQSFKHNPWVWCISFRRVE